MARSKFWMVPRTFSSCEAASRESRVRYNVASTAITASARMMRINAITQPQLRETVAGSRLLNRPGIACGTAFPGWPACWAMNSVSASPTDGMTSVCPASKPGAVNRRSGVPSAAGSLASVAITSVTASSAGVSEGVSGRTVVAASSPWGCSAGAAAVVSSVDSVLSGSGGFGMWAAY